MKISDLLFSGVILLVLLLSNVICIPDTASAGFGGWTQRNPSAQSLHIQGLAYGKSLYVAYTLEGYVYSYDFVNWHQAATRVRYSVDRTKFLNGIFYGLPGGPVYSSNDGITWQEEKFPVFSNIRDIAFGKSLLVAVGDDGIFVAEQGQPWRMIEKPDVAGLTGVAYGNGFFVAVGKDGTVLTSESGTDWVSVDLKMKDNFTAIAFGNGTFVASTELQTKKGSLIHIGPRKTTTTTNGQSWSAPVEYEGNMGSLIWKKGRFWGASASKIFSSRDGVTWETLSLDSKMRIQNIIDGGDILVGVGNGLYTSADGEKWNATVSGTTKSLNAVTYAKGLYVAVGSDGTIVTSPDGRKWREQHVKFNRFSDSLHTVLEAKGKLLAIGSNSFFSSTDGMKWIQESKPPLLPFKAAIGKEALVAVCVNGKVLRSTDMKNWTVIETGTGEQITAVTYGSGVFVAIGGNNTILTSEDEGRSWKIQKSERDLVLPRLCYGKGMFLLAANDRGYYGQQHLYSSEDGVTWQEVQSEETPKAIQSLVFIKDNFVATTSGSKIFSSTNGRMWTISDTKVLGGFKAITYGNGSYIAVGSNGRIAQAEAVR